MSIVHYHGYLDRVMNLCFFLCFRKMTVPIGLIDAIIDPGFLLLDVTDFKYFKLLTYLDPPFRIRIVWVIETESHLF
jgi:hypothetical protein